MTEEMRNLQAQYIEGVETMSEADVRRYYALLEADYGAEYRERRLEVLGQRIRAIEGQARAEQRKKDVQAALMRAKRDFYEITDRWEAQGALRYYLHERRVEAWSYEGTEIYRWGAGYRPTMFEMLADAQRIDAELTFE